MGNIFGFYKTRHILLADSANCTVLRAVVLTQYRSVTDGQTGRQTDRRKCYSYYSACNASISARCIKDSRVNNGARSRACAEVKPLIRSK